MVTEADDAEAFSSFVVSDGARLRRVLVAHYGVEVGAEVSSDALAWAWEHWDRVHIQPLADAFHEAGVPVTAANLEEFSLAIFGRSH